MEKTWDDFYKSGKVTDYLRYRNAITDPEEKERYQEEQSYNVADSSVDRDGADSHARR